MTLGELSIHFVILYMDAGQSCLLSALSECLGSAETLKLRGFYCATKVVMKA